MREIELKNEMWRMEYMNERGEGMVYVVMVLAVEVRPATGHGWNENQECVFYAVLCSCDHRNSKSIVINRQNMFVVY